MPRLDGTGPMGRGPRTGFGMGRCVRFPSQMRGNSQVVPTKEQQLKILKENKEVYGRIDTELRKKLNIGNSNVDVPEVPASGPAEAKEAVRGRKG